MKYNPFASTLKNALWGVIALATLMTSCDSCKPPIVDPPDGPVTAAFTHNLQADCPTPCQVCFTNSSQNADTYSWDFGNGQTSSEASPCVTYAGQGTYTVTLTARAGAETTTSTQVLVIQNQINGYKRNFGASAGGVYGKVTKPLVHNGLIYGIMNWGGSAYVAQFSNDGYITANLLNAGFQINDLVADLDEGILCVGEYGSPASIAFTKLKNGQAFAHYYNLGFPAHGYSVVPKNTNSDPGYIVVGQLENGTGYHEGGLVNTFSNGNLYFPDAIDYSKTVKKIFRNPDSGSASYVAIGEWLDPTTQRRDIHISTVNENGVDYLPLNLYPGLNNAFDDQVKDAAQSITGASYAIVGFLGGKPTFLTFNYQNQSFTQPVIKQDFASTVSSLKSVCALNNGQGFVVCGTEKISTVPFDNSIFVAKIDNAGNIVWKKTFGNYSEVEDICATPDGGFLVAGQELCPDLLCANPVLYKLDSNGNYQ